MAISYPLSFPNDYIQNITLRMVSAVAESQSPFTFESQFQVYDGQRWEMDITLAPMDRPQAAAWVGFLGALNGKQGYFLAGDPAGATIAGTATAATISGSAGDSTVSATVTSGRTLKSGDYFQLGTGADSTLHMVTQDFTGTGSAANLEIFPALRKDRTSVAANLTAAKGLFGLASNTSSVSISQVQHYGFTFVCSERIT
jgi:hypothetical protein